MSEAGLLHEPLPYVVVLRVRTSEDVAPVVVEKRLDAYSVIEAVTAAIIEATGQTPNDAKYDVQSVGPDVAEYLQRKLASQTPPTAQLKR